MKNILIALRSLFKKGRHNGIKILSLGAGLAVGLVLIAKVYFEQSYDYFFPDYDRIYYIQSMVERDNELNVWPRVSGAIAPGMKAEVPGVEVATRFTSMGDDVVFITPDRRKYSGNFIFADTSLFEIFPRPILAGNPKEILARPMYVMISESLARKMGGDVIGKTFWLDSAPKNTLTIGGIFKDLPENSHLNYDVIVSLPSIGYYSRDGSNNWLGNDRYIGYVKLSPGVDAATLAPAIRRMQENNQPLEEVKKAGTDLHYQLYPLAEWHNESKSVKRMVLLLSLLAFALLFTAVMNYVLLVISDTVNRSKEIAVHKCYGASEKNIHSIVFSDAIIHVLLAILLAVGLILLFRGTVQDLVEASVGALFVSKGSFWLLAICLVILLVSGFVPGSLYARIPVASAFRNFRENRRLWKLGLLFLQFIAAGFLVSLLAVIGKQYDYMKNDRPGYAYDKLAYCSLAGIDSTARRKAIEEVSRLPEVQMVSSCTNLFFERQSGNNVGLPGEEREYFNVADQYWVGNNFFDLMEIPIVAGRPFLEDGQASHEVMVSRSFVDKMSLMAGWNQEAVGKSVLITEHSLELYESFTICGVYEDVRLQSISDPDSRPSVMFYNPFPSHILLIKFHRFTPEAKGKVAETLQKLLPDKNIVINSWQTEMGNLYLDSRQFLNAVLIGGIITLLISLIGLIGYTNDEINRRRKEIAIRRVSGATFNDVASLFLIDILRIALPALILGGGAAFYAASKWQEQFSDKVSLSFMLFLGCGLAVLGVILAVVMMNIYRATNTNPVDCLKSE